jgi:lysozyme family protein
MANVEKLLPIILQWEGGYQNHKEDTGNYLDGELIGTNKGITPAAYLRSYGVRPTIEIMKGITENDVLYVLKRFYWDRWQADKIKNQSVANFLVDWVWGSGVHGIRIPQQVIGVANDGYVGDITIGTLNSWDQLHLFTELKKSRIDFIEKIVSAKKSNEKFRNGWINRINFFKFEP